MKSETDFLSRVNEIHSLPYPESIEIGEPAPSILLVIGESASRDHHGIYGYPLATTPRLESMRDSLVIFQDVIGSSSSTGDCVPKILTFESDEPHDEPWSAFPSIFQLMNEMGYKTFWLSNQDRVGNNKGTYAVIASQASTVKYVGTENVNDHLSAKYDEVLLPEITEAVRDTAKSKLIVVHLFGSHTRYTDRYPNSRSHFTARDVMAFNKKKWIDDSRAKVIAEYDNSIRYTDSIIGEAINIIGNARQPYVMIYVSDHGENVYDDRDFIGRDDKFVSVPMIAYMNRAYRELFPENQTAIAGSSSRRISSSMIIHSLLTIIGGQYALYDGREDFLSKDFKERVRYADREPYNGDFQRAK